MDYNMTKFDVASEQICLEQTAELPIDADFSVADYLADIKKVLKCKITPYISSRQITGNVLVVEGTAMISVIYANDTGAISSAEQEVPFKKSFETNRLMDGGSCKVFAAASTHACRAVTERKLSVKGSVRLDATVFTIEKTEIISDIDSDCFEQLRGETPATTPLGIAEKTLVIDEELILPQNMPAAQRILRSGASALVTDCKIISNKIIVKGNVRVCVLYCTKEDALQKHTADIPFNQIIDLIGIGEHCECEARADVCGLSLSSRTLQNGECRSFMLTSKLLITAAARCDSDIPVVFDAYSTRFTASIQKNDVCFTRIAKQVNESFLCKKKITLPEGSMQQIADLWCGMNPCTARADGSGMIIAGGIAVNAITVDSNAEPGFAERIIDFEYPISVEGELKRPKCRPEVQILNSDFSVTGPDELELRIELMIHATVYDSDTIPLITGIEVDETAPIAADSAALIAYYADRGENVWEISKSFLANREELLELNHITEDVVQTPKMLLIPRM